MYSVNPLIASENNIGLSVPFWLIDANGILNPIFYAMEGVYSVPPRRLELRSSAPEAWACGTEMLRGGLGV